MTIDSTISEPAVPPPRAERPPDLLLQWVVLSISTVVLLAAATMSIRGSEQVLLPGTQIPLPGTCTYKRLTGTECPGCGLTRCFISIAHGDFSAAWGFNAAGILLFLFVVLQLPYRSLQIWRIKRGRHELRFHRWTTGAFIFIAAAMIIQWLIRTAMHAMF